jgi:hypothetical protein
MKKVVVAEITRRVGSPIYTIRIQEEHSAVDGKILGTYEDRWHAYGEARRLAQEQGLSVCTDSVKRERFY